jgi:hypothetical protein
LESEATPLGAVMAKAAMWSNEKEQSIMAKLTNVIASHKRASIATAFGLAALIFFLAVPFPYQRIVGYRITLSGVEIYIPDGDLAKSMEALGYTGAQINVVASPDGFDYEIGNLPSMAAAKEVAAATVSLTGTKVSPVIAPEIELVSGSLYAQARERLVRIEVDGKGKTDDQIKAEIESKLVAQGLSPGFIFVKTDSTGERRIQMEIGEKGVGHGGMETTIEIDGRGKSNAQIEDEVKARMALQGHPNANVTIESSGPDSLREIRIEIQDSVGQ